MAFGAGNKSVTPVKSSAPVKSAAPVASQDDAFIPGKPTHTLKVKIGKDGKYQRITGLFLGTTKAGEEYLRGTDRENDATYVIMPNTFDAKKNG